MALTTLKPFTRGDTFIADLNLTNGWEFDDFESLFCTIRREIPESDVVSDAGSLGKVAVTGSGTAIRIRFEPAVTTLWPGETTLYGDIQGIYGGVVKTLDKFRFTCEGDVTREASS